MNPILLGKQVEQGLEDLVRYNFQTNSKKFEGMVETFLSDPRTFFKGPWVSVELPFQDAKTNTEPFPEIPLRYEPYRHQELAFDRLRVPNPKSTLIATGTGSGKTEGYLWPILDACRQNKGNSGIKAIIIYPMNALATDQARRIAKVIADTPALEGIRCGLYADQEPENANQVMSANNVITSRRQMQENPPDILLTNYKMLDLLLLRSDDKKLWEKNTPETFQFLVVDELHTFDGAQGTDLALLIRRLKARLSTPEQYLVCIGSSATLGIDQGSQELLTSYAEKIFGEPFQGQCVITEDRKELRDEYQNVDYINLPDAENIVRTVREGQEQNQVTVVYELARLFFDDQDLNIQNLADEANTLPDDTRWRLDLGKLLWSHVAFQRVVEAIHKGGKAVAIDVIVERLSEAKFLSRGWSREQLTALVEAVVILAAWARRRKNPDSDDQPLLNIRVQAWAREMGRMIALPPSTEAQKDQHPAILRHSDDLDERELNRALPVVICRNCGLTGLACRVNENAKNKLWETPSILYAEWFDKSERIRILYFEEIKVLRSSKGPRRVIDLNIDPRTLEYNREKEKQNDGNYLSAWLYNPIDGENRSDERRCPSCGTGHALLILGMRTARLTAGLTTTLFNSEHHEADDSKPRVLMFSDSVQDAAQRAAVNEIRNKRLVVEKTTYNIVKGQDQNEIKLSELVGSAVEQERIHLGDAKFVAKYVARDQIWRDDYQDLLQCEEEQQFSGQCFAPEVGVRLGWDIFANLTFRSRAGQTLETSNLCVADVRPNKLLDASEDFQQRLYIDSGNDFYLDENEAFSFLFGIAVHMRRNGAVAHNFVSEAVKSASRVKGLDFIGAGYRLVRKNKGVLPNIHASSQFSPVIPSTHSLGIHSGTSYRASRQFQYVASKQRSNWYRTWVNKFFPGMHENHKRVYHFAFEALQRNELVAKFETFGSENLPVWLLNPDAVSVTTRVALYNCDTCGRKECFPEYDYRPLRCLKIGCEGYLRSIRDSSESSDSEGDDVAELDYSRYFKNILSTKKNHRVVAREHTGLLEADDRRTIEEHFINGERPWHPNLISATPTLELGIDIGKLSTLVLASVPPDVANYVQRIGRTGRRDGNSLNITLVSARPHDLQFWEDPTPMLKGQITPPGVYLEAIAVLRRQAAAFALDRFVAEVEVEFGKGVVKNAIASIERNLLTEFPLNWFSHLQPNASEIANDFIEFLPEDVKEKESIRTAINSYLKGIEYNRVDGLESNVRNAFDEAKKERLELIGIRKDLNKDIRKLSSTKLKPLDIEVQLRRLRKRRAEVNKTIRETIDNVNVLKFLNDRGILPNYAFPEAGVKLKSIIIREREDREYDYEGDGDVLIKEYQRPASLAITELAPDQTFYAEGREVKINRLDLREKDITERRFCQNCNYSEKNDTASQKSVCPRCNSKSWSDIGSSVQTVELKSVIANTTEQKASIKDLDGRFQRHYDTEIIPNYDQELVEKAYIVVESEKPFGIEFISLCEFRHINYGERAAVGTKIQIAGKDRNTRPFKICQYCGTLQKSGYEDDSSKISRDHEARCRAEDFLGDREKWEATVFLINTFHTEALRMIVPVPGEANFDEIKSFVAGVELGLRKYFKGRVDHIRSTVVEDRIESGAMVRNLFFYDTIPGGSGYLRQLALNPESLLKVFDYASKALRQCPCNHEEDKNGCFRCVKPYRSQFGRGEPKRDTALHLIDAVLSNWDSLKEVKTSIDKDLGPSILESALESKFVHHLGKQFGPENLKDIVLGSGRRGYQLKVPLSYTSEDLEVNESNSNIDTSDKSSNPTNENSQSQGLSSSAVTTQPASDTLGNEALPSEEPDTSNESLNQSASTESNESPNSSDTPETSTLPTENTSIEGPPKEKSIYWTIEPQVQIDKRFPRLPPKRVDFLITSTHPKATKPIVVELDGFKYHYDTVRKDVEDRIQMIKSGQVQVWTLLWDDFDDKTPNYYNPFGPTVITSQFDEPLKKLFQSARAGGSSLCQWERAVEILRSESSIDGLLEHLKRQPWTPSEATTLLAMIRFSAIAKFRESVSSKELDESSRLFWQQGEKNLRLTDGSLSLFAGVPECSPTQIAEHIDRVRMVLFADLEDIDEDNTNPEEFKKIWSSLWRSVNFLQDLKGFHIALPGMDTLEPSLTPDLRQIISDLTNALWQEVFELSEDEVLGTIKSLCNANLPVPDMIGADVMVEDTVACTVEFGWSHKKFAVALESSVAEGWTILEHVDPSSAGYAEFLQKIIDVVLGDD